MNITISVRSPDGSEQSASIGVEQFSDRVNPSLCTYGNGVTVIGELRGDRGREAFESFLTLVDMALRNNQEAR
jgi:hypothetical protein